MKKLLILLATICVLSACATGQVWKVKCDNSDIIKFRGQLITYDEGWVLYHNDGRKTYVDPDSECTASLSREGLDE